MPLLRNMAVLRRYCVLGVGLAIAAVTVPGPCVAAVLQLQHYLSWQRISSPQISPDGRTIVYNIARANIQADRFDDELWVMNANGDDNRRLASGRGAVWSPDSTRIAYLDAGKIFVRRIVDDSAATEVGAGGLKPSDLSWSPDGAWIAFRGWVAERPEWTIDLPRPAAASWSADPVVTDRLQFRATGGVRGGYRHIFVVPAGGGEVRQLTSGKFEVGGYYAVVDRSPGLAWTPDSRSILFSANMEPDADLQFRRSAVHAVEAATGVSRKVTRTQGFWLKPLAAPDGRSVAYWGTIASDEAYPPYSLRVSALDGSGERTLIAELPGDIHFLDWARDGRGLYYVADKEGSRNLRFVSLDGKVRDVTSGPQVLGISSISANGVIAATRTTPTQPEDVVRFDSRDGGKLQQLTNVNESLLKGVQLSRVEEIWYPSADGVRVQGWIMYPPSFDASRKYPLILYIHGGPHMMYDVAFTFRFQEMAANGYVVVYVNPRGSTGYGATFANAIDNRYPGPELPDLMGAVEQAVKRGSIDTQRLYITGCSGGGALTNRMVAHTTRFAAAASLCSPNNWISMAGSGDTKLWLHSTVRPSFWQNTSHWLELSPLMHAPKVKTPVLLITGADDVRTPPGQAEEFYSALKLHGTPTRLVLLNNQGHGWPSIPSNFMRTQLYTRKWFEEWRRVESSGEVSWISAR